MLFLLILLLYKTKIISCNIIASFDCKFKTNHENIEKIFQHYGLRKIQSSLYAGDLDNNEKCDLCENIQFKMNVLKGIIQNDSKEFLELLDYVESLLGVWED